MKIGIISDIHSNMEALLAVLDDMGPVDKVIFLGDVVGYGADPEFCIKIVREIADIMVCGNHDFACCGLTSIRYFNEFAKRAVIWTSKKLSKKDLNFLANLPLKAKYEDMLFVHSTPFEPQNWHYIFTPKDAVTSFWYFEEKICFVGHSHVPMNFSIDSSGMVHIFRDDEISFEDDKRYIVNVGSVGQPRDGDPKAAYGILDLEKKSFKLKRVEYDVEKAKEKIISVGLPPYLGERLLYGR